MVSVPVLSQDLINREEAYPIDCSVDPASAEALEEAIASTDLKPPVFFITLLPVKDHWPNKIYNSKRAFSRGNIMNTCMKLYFLCAIVY